MNSYRAHNDEPSRMVFKVFEDHLKPLIAQVAPDWLLHHMVMHRTNNPLTMGEEVEIRLVIRPIGSANFVDDDQNQRERIKQLTGT